MARRSAPFGSPTSRTRSANSVKFAANSHAASARPQAAPIECAPVAASVTNATAVVTTNASFNRDKAASRSPRFHGNIGPTAIATRSGTMIGTKVMS
jgi:hypothetical protein